MTFGQIYSHSYVGALVSVIYKNNQKKTPQKTPLLFPMISSSLKTNYAQTLREDFNPFYSGFHPCVYSKEGKSCEMRKKS